MSLSSNPGRAAHTLSHFRAPSGGRTATGPAFVNRRVPVGPNRAITLRTDWREHRTVYLVVVVDNFNVPNTIPQEFPTLRRARNAANKLYAQLTEEN